MMAGLAMGLSVGGCSYDLGSLLGKDGEKTRVAGSRSAVVPASRELPSDADLAYASAAAADVLTKGSKDISAPWENPRTGARGTVTPIATEYPQDGSTCREFLASYVAKENEAWLQGEACQVHQGKWVVRSLKPWQRTRDGSSRSPSAAAPATDS
jgi:surface antigen